MCVALLAVVLLGACHAQFAVARYLQFLYTRHPVPVGLLACRVGMAVICHVQRAAVGIHYAVVPRRRDAVLEVGGEHRVCVVFLPRP